MTRMHRGIALALVATMLAGCGQAAFVPPAQPGVTGMAGMALRSSSATALATSFAKSVENQAPDRVTRNGAIVTIESGDSTTRYDFTATPRTQQVTITADGVSVQVSYATLTAQATSSQIKFAPLVLLPIALDVAFAGAKAYAVYWFTHRHDFNKHDAIQAVVTGMGQALVGYLPMGFLLKWLVPIVVKFVMNTSASDYTHALHDLMSQLDDIVHAIKHMLAGDPAPQVSY
ncbi:MAG TPA: hypothetical protein V6D47_06125 [Oscillatoriaceae cyanobacterium]